DGAPCDDGIACTNDSFCLAGVCGGGASNCTSDNLCEPTFCNLDSGESESATISCDGMTLEPDCYQPVGTSDTGSSRTTGGLTCGPECDVGADCDDGNACTADVCKHLAGYTVCEYSLLKCDDGDDSTVDFCVNPTVGCEHRVANPADLCDDGVACT